MKRKCLILFTLIAVLIFTENVRFGNAATLSAELPGNTLTINGQIDPQRTAFSKAITVTATAPTTVATVGPIDLLRRPLRRVSGSAIVPPGDIPAESISIPTSYVLTIGQPRELTVTISNVTRPGTYEGMLTLYATGDKDARLDITVRLIVTIKPDVRPPASALSFQVADSSWLTAWTLPYRLKTGAGTGLLDVQTPDDVDLDHVEVVLHGQSSSSTMLLIPSQSHCDHANPLPAASLCPFTLHVDPDKVEPDRYEGYVRIWMKDVAAPITIPVTVDVRAGPGLVIVVLLLGVVCGRVVQHLSSPDSQRKLTLLARIYKLETDINHVENIEFRAELSGRLATAKRDIDHFNALDNASTAITEMEKTIRDLAQLEGLETRAIQANRLSEIASALAAGRTDAMDGRNQDTQLAIVEINRILREAPPHRGAMAIEQTLQEATLSEHNERLAAIPSLKRRGVMNAACSRIGRALGIVAGIRWPTAEVDYFILRPLFFVVLLFVLVVAGFSSLYLHGGATFGVNGAYDYLGLFLWGLGADVAQKTLQNIQLLKPSD